MGFQGISSLCAQAAMWTVSGPQTKDDCKNGGWESYGFKNQRHSVRYVETGKDSRG